jgi:hypothetical protein
MSNVALIYQCMFVFMSCAVFTRSIIYTLIIATNNLVKSKLILNVYVKWQEQEFDFWDVMTDIQGWASIIYFK